MPSVVTSRRVARRIVITVIGGSVLLLGVALLALPGPAFVVIPLGLALLATEYAWARHWLHKARTLLDPANGSQPSSKPQLDLKRPPPADLVRQERKL